MKFKDIPQFPRTYYRIDVSLRYLKEELERWDERPTSPLILNPEWQRGHVWNEEQKTKYIEYFLMGGTTGREIYFNCSSWGGKYNTPVYCLDGLQRLTSALDFLDNKIKAFGCFYDEFEDQLSCMSHTLSFNMLNMKKKKELLSNYINFNSGGTPHNPEEIERVKKMFESCGDEEI